MKSRTVQISFFFFLLFFSSFARSDQIEWPVKGNGFAAVIVSEPLSNYRILPFTEKIDNAVPGDRISLVAAPDSYEPASFVVRSGDSELKGVRVSITDLLTGADGGGQKVFPKENIDIKTVKCWYQAGSAGRGITQHKEIRVLVPELLLNDDSLVKVDLQKKENYLKLSFPDGARYVWISNPEDMKKPQFPSVDAYPVVDSPELLPVDIPPRTNLQFWITVHVPKGTEADTYSGSVNIVTSDGVKKHLTLKLRVLPFKLLPPYYTSSIFYRGRLEPSGKGTISSEYKDEKQFRAELKDLYAHGVTNPIVYEAFHKPVFEKVLRIRDETGMGRQPLYYLGLGKKGTGNPSAEAELEALKGKVKSIVDLCRSYGIPDVYFYGMDEAGGEALKSQRAAWEAVHEAGGKVFVAGSKKSNFEAMGDIQDLLISAGTLSRAEADRWHSKGHKIWSYADPQAGIENPEIYRRNYGLLLWKNGYDGAATYAYQNSFGNIWNDFDHPVHRDTVFAYPRADGVIDTIEWEGYREGVTDVRYLTTLLHGIEEARKSDDESRKLLAREASAYLDKLDAGRSNLSDIRPHLIDYILRLQEAGQVQ